MPHLVELLTRKPHGAGILMQVSPPVDVYLDLHLVPHDNKIIIVKRAKKSLVSGVRGRGGHGSTFTPGFAIKRRL